MTEKKPHVMPVQHLLALCLQLFWFFSRKKVFFYGCGLKQSQKTSAAASPRLRLEIKPCLEEMKRAQIPQATGTGLKTLAPVARRRGMTREEGLRVVCEAAVEKEKAGA